VETVVDVEAMEQWARGHLGQLARAGVGKQSQRYTVAERTLAELLAFARQWTAPPGTAEAG
jgi:hypothetical protein